MRIATLTYHSANNNGAFLQAFALQRALIDDLCVQNEIIDYESEELVRHYSIFRKGWSKSNLLYNIISLIHYPALKRRKLKFESLRKKNLRVTKHCISIDDVTTISNQFDAVIVGSDQMWNSGIKDFSRAYFLPGVHSKKYTYSVSLGSRADGVSQSLLNDNVRKFDGISVREKSAKNRLAELTNSKIHISLDPTLLLEKNDYDVLMRPKRMINQEYIFFYSINYQTEVVDMVLKISNELNLPVYAAGTGPHSFVAEMKGIKVVWDAGPEEFLNMLNNSKLVVTNSFHGTVFSIIFEKEFYCLFPEQKGLKAKDERIDDLLSLCGLDERIVIPSTVNEAKTSRKIDYSAVKQKLIHAREDSFNYLREIVEQGGRP